MKLTSKAFADGQPIPIGFAFGRIDAASHVALSDNRNPHLEWSEVPEGTRSFVVICHDYDVPTQPDDVNQEGREVPASLARTDFFHWLLVDIPAATRSIADGEYSHQVTPKGKGGPETKQGTRQGVNDFTQWFAADHDMRGDYYGYDGPCPPWNDAIVHHYVFTLYALDVPRCAVEGRFTGQDVRAAIAGHVLGEARLTGTYTLNPALAAT